MPQLTFVSGGHEDVVDATSGDSVMTTATRSGVRGIVGECGGNASCATCHVWVREEFIALVGPPNDLEEDLLDLAVTERRDGSRLSCQIEVSPELEGLTMDIPPDQP